MRTKLAVLLLLVITLVTAQGVKFSAFSLQGKIKEFEWIGKEVAIVLTDEHAYETVDGGLNWTQLNPDLCQELHCARKIAKSDINEDAVLLLGANAEENWLLSNLVQKKHVITKVRISDKHSHVTRVRWHPQEPNTLLALVTRKNTRGLDLYISKDGGKTFGASPLRSQVEDAQWASPDAQSYSPHVLHGIRLSDGEKTLFELDTNSLASDDYIIKDVEEFFHIKQFLFVATRDPSSGESGLYTSTNNGKSFNRAKFSSELFDEAQAAYTILDASEGSVFVNVFRNVHGNEPFGDVYLSDATGVRYSFSLAGNRRKRFKGVDFHKLESLEGVYIANMVSPEYHDDHDCKNCIHDCDDKCKYTSVISFDKGGEWKFLMAPERDSNGKKIFCKSKIPGTDRCHLHLHGFVAQGTSRIHSHKNAVGLVFATGNYGNYLNPSEIDVNTFLSRDGGLTWTEIAKGSHVYEMTDYGGLILLAPDKSFTHKLMYSWTQGQNFTEVEFADKKAAMVIEKIHHPKDPLSRHLLVQGAREGQAILLHVDFSEVHQQECKGIANPADPDSDYEYFKPHSYESDKCLLGRIVEYTRRKADRPCFNPEQARPPMKIANCPCIFADYTCDLYFERDFQAEEGTKLLCKVVPGDEDKVNQVPSPCNGYYNQTRGYIKVAGDTCVGGINLDPIPRKCPATISFFGIVLLVFFLFIILSFTSIYLYKNTSFLQNMINGPLNGLISYNPVHQQEEGFGLSDNEDDSEPDELEESTFSNFKRGEVASPVDDDPNDFKVASLDPIVPQSTFNPRAPRNL